MESALIAALVSIIVVVISAYGSFYGLIITRANKISEIRQAWIDELRKDISDYIGYSQEHAFYYSHIRNSNEDNSRNTINDHFSFNSHTVISIYTRIILRLDKANHLDLLNVLFESYKDYSDMLNNDKYSSDLDNHLTKVREQAITVLDDAWKTVQIGEEVINRIRKSIPYAAGGIVIVLVIIIACTIIYE